MECAGFPADTIAAVATPPGRSTRAVVRISGRDSIEALAAWASEGAALLRAAAGYTVVPLRLDLNGVSLAVTATVFRAPRSFTREDLVEVALPGATPLIGCLLEALLTGPSGEGTASPDVRSARPGEFTLRAFLNGRIDLSQAEALAQLIAAAEEDEARASRRGLRGELRAALDELHEFAVETLALLEAGLDFPDEDLSQVAPTRLEARVRELEGRLRRLRGSCRLRAARRGVLRVVFAGFPNAGKSSLFNAVLGRPAAIVSETAGTTRDPVRAVSVEAGRPVEWIDLAGVLSASLSTLPGEGPAGEESSASGLFGVAGGNGRLWEVVRRLTRLELESADVVVWVMEPGATCEASLEQFDRLPAGRKFLVVQKADLLARTPAGGVEASPYPRRLRVVDGDRVALGAADSEALSGGEALLVSAHTGEGIRDLRRRVLEGVPSAGEAPLGVAPRFLLSAHQEAALSLAAEALERAAVVLRDGSGSELAAADLRDALDALEDLTGRVTPDVILGHVFSRFCVGK